MCAGSPASSAGGRRRPADAELLGRSTDDALTSVERAELETLVKMAEFPQLLAVVALETKAAWPLLDSGAPPTRGAEA
jgi:hypothetical protein